MLGEWHLRTLTILGYPNLTRPGLLDALNHQDFAYRWVTRFLALDKTEAGKALTRIRRQWFNKRKSIAVLLREVIHNEPVQLLDRSEEHTSELQSLMRISYAVFCLKNKTTIRNAHLVLHQIFTYRSHS